MKKKYLIVISIVLILVSAFGIYFTKYAKSASSQQSELNYVSFNVKKGNIRVSASGTGNIEPSIRKEIKNLDNGQIIDKVFVEKGQIVKEGDLILTFESDSTDSQIEQIKLELSQQESKLYDLHEELDNLKVYAPESGFLENINANVGDELSKGHSLATISNKAYSEISGLYNGKQIENIKVGDKAEVTLPDSFYTIEGTVTRVNYSPLAQDGGGVLYEAVVEVKNPGGLSENTKGIVVINNDNGSFTSLEQTYFKMKSPEEVKLNTNGKLSKLYFSSGDYVEKGDLIAELESDELLDNIENQQIAIDKTKLQLSDKLKSLDDTAVYAPISGTITQLNVTEGERVNSNSVMAVISDLNNLQVIIPIDELDINKVQIGQQAIVTSEALPNKNINAEVSDIALEGVVNNGVATYDVTLKLKDIDGLKPGMTVNAAIIIEEKSDALLIPIEAVQQNGNNRFVLVKDGDNEPEMIPIKIGLVSEDYVEITEGLNERDTIVYPVTSNNNTNFMQRGIGMMPPMEGPGIRRSTERGR